MRALLAALAALGLLRPQGEGRAIIPTVRSTRGETCFDPPAGMIDWKLQASRALGARAISRPDTAELRRNAFEATDESSIPFQLRLPANLESKGWLLVHDGGVSAMPGILLRGKVTYTIRADTEIVGEPKMSGRACLSASVSAPRAAFVLSGVAGTGWNAEEVVPTKGIGDEYVLSVDGKKFSVRRTELTGPRPRRMLLLRPPGARPLLLVAWESGGRCDAVCCDAVYDLFQIEPDHLTALGQNASPCES